MEEEKFLKETPTMSNPLAMVRLEKHDTEAARQIRHHRSKPTPALL